MNSDTILSIQLCVPVSTSARKNTESNCHQIKCYNCLTLPHYKQPDFDHIAHFGDGTKQNMEHVGLHQRWLYAGKTLLIPGTSILT